jgi:glycosyltransferase involved in cell wall biosynthesis
MSDPSVSLIVAVYNGEAYLREALESAFAQEFEPYEVVVVDDGSTDGTAEIARSFPARYLYQENQGPSTARNAGLDMARGELIAFLDGDDVLPPSKLAVQWEYLREHPATACVLGRNDWIFENGAEPSSLRRDPVYGELGGIQPGTAMIRKHVLDELGGFDSTYRYWEFQNLFVRMREHGVQIDVLPEVVLRKRLHGANATLFPPEQHPLLRTMKEKLERGRRS